MQLFPGNTLSSFTNFLPEQLNLECHCNLQFRKNPTHQGTKMSRRENLCFLTGNFQSHQNSKTLKLLFTLPLPVLLKPWTLSFKRDTTTAKIVYWVSKTQKVETYLANGISGLAFLSTDLGHTFGSNAGEEFGVMLRGKRSHKPEFAYDLVDIHSLRIYTDLIEYNFIGDTKAPLLRCFTFNSKLNAFDIILFGQ